MQVRKFEAVDMHAAVAAIKDEMGPDAMILSTRQLDSGGLFSKPRIEVVAALDQAAAPATPMTAALRRAQQTYSRSASPPPAARPSAASHYETAAVEGDESCLDWLGAADVERDLAAEIADAARQRTGATDRALIDVLRDRLRRYTDSHPRRDGVLALVGPTGVGKTTTVAKLAARAALVDDRRVALITLDTYRIGAVDQLRHYAELIRVPMEVCRNGSAFTEAVRRHGDADLILVDTAGRGPGDADQIASLRNTFAGHGVSVLLTVAATTRCAECSELIRRFDELEPEAVVLTKVDEASALGAAVNLPHQLARPLSYITFGQRVPEDIAPPDAERLARLLVARARSVGAFPSMEVQPWN